MTTPKKGGNLTARLLNRGDSGVRVLNAGVSPGATMSATINYTLTDFATGHMNDLADTYEYAERICPTVSVPGLHGQYKKFDDVNSFQIYNTRRANGADPTRIMFAAEDEYYNCAPQALEITIDEAEKLAAGTSNPVAQQLLEQGKTKALMNAVALSYAYNRTNYVLNNVTAVANRGNFSNPNIDPIDQIDEQIDQLSGICGSINNIKITMDVSAWRAIRTNALSKRRLVGVKLGEITLQEFQDMLIFPCDTKVYSLSYIPAPGTGPAGGGSQTVNTPTAGEFTTPVRFLSGVVLIHYSVPNPTLYDPSAFKAFTVGSQNVQAIRTYQDPAGFYSGIIADWSEDIELTSSKAIRRLTIS